MRALLLTLAVLAAPASAQGGATYRVTFESTWSAATHPAGFPANAHFSQLVGTAHAAAVSFWTPGELASTAIEEMAERGRFAALMQEFTAAMPEALPGHVGQDLPVSPGSAETFLSVSPEHPLLTLVTMLAPSPDWFVGVHGLDLRVNGAWPDHAVVPLAAYDAGTDSGVAYTSPDADTLPREAIALLGTAPFVAGAPVGTFTFERLATAAEGAPSDAAFVLGAPSPNPVRSSATLTLSVAESQQVRVRLVDALGRTVAVLADAAVASGTVPLS
ncbi:MAG TPA: spondin domain-containing protein, partial [Rubricoccaceae bacterium]